MTTQDPLADMRKSYEGQPLSKADMASDPVAQFRQWFADATESNESEANVMTLATCGKNLQPNARTVLLKGIEKDGFIFFSNYNSRKANELTENPLAALLFYWDTLSRQIRIEGKVSKLDDASSEQYFQSRPVGSQIGAWASPQSQVIADRKQLESKVDQVAKQYAGTNKLPKPPFWGGYVLIPHYFEFWQGQANRLHDRIAYSRGPNDSRWTKSRLAP